jgi:hypothetical protein
MADVLFVFPLTQDEAEVPDSFELVSGFHVISEADDSTVKGTTIVTGLHLVDIAEVDPVVMELGTGLTLVNHGGLTRAQIDQVFLERATAVGLVTDGDAGSKQSESGGGAGSDISVTLTDVELITGYTAP